MRSPLERGSLGAGDELLARIRRQHFDLMRLVNALDRDRVPDAVAKYVEGAMVNLDDAQELLGRLLVLEVGRVSEDG